MTFPWRQLPWLQDKEYPNLGRSSDNDSADTQGFGSKMTEGQWITWGSQVVKHPMYTHWLQFLLEWPSAQVVSATKIPKLVWPCGHIWVTGALNKSTCCKPARAAQLSHPETPLTLHSQAFGIFPQSKGSNTGSSLSLRDPDTAFSTSCHRKGCLHCWTFSIVVGSYLMQSALFRTNLGRTVTLELGARLFMYQKSPNSHYCSTTNAAAKHYLGNTGTEWITAPWKL